MIVAEQLRKQFEDFIAVDSIDLQVKAGEVLALLGPNGAGKTTTVRMLTSVLKPTSGRASIAGFDVQQDAKKVRSVVGVLTENHGLYNRMRAIEYLDFFGQIYGLEESSRKVQITRLLDQFGLNEASRRRVGEYSKGMRQKLALARSLLHDPAVLLLDEPTSAMDPESANLVRNMIKDLRSKDRAILICTHNLAEAEELSDRIAIIRNGSIIANGTPAELRERLLGPEVYEVVFSEVFGGNIPDIELDGKVKIVAFGEDRVRYTCLDPRATHPVLLKKLVDDHYEVLYIQEVKRSLEKVYLQAVNGGGDYAG